MITVKFYGYSDVEEYINNTKLEVEDTFQMYYPNSEVKVHTIDDEFQFIFKDDWSDLDEIDEDIIRDICNTNEIYCSILIGEKTNKSYYYDEDENFVYK